MSNFAKTHVGSDARVELHNAIGLTGAEVSINNLPACVRSFMCSLRLFG